MVSHLGMYGKLPTKGDFVNRNVSQHFVYVWDEWLQQATVSAQQKLGEAWLQTYLVAPVWQFVLQAGVIDQSAWLGVVAPSVDRVGRYFPLTFVYPIAEPLDPLVTYFANRAWLSGLVDGMYQALQPNLEFSELEQWLASYPPPVVKPVTPALSSAPVCGLPVVLNLSHVVEPQASLAALSASIAHAANPCVVWGTEHGEQQLELWLLATQGLPNAEQSCALLDLNFNAHGWRASML